MTIKYSCLFSFLVLFLAPEYKSCAQEFAVKTLLDNVPATGFYKIAITPDLTAYTKNDLSDIRIVHDSNIFVPYINQKDLKNAPGDHFMPFTILNNLNNGKFTIVDVENTVLHGITDLSLVIGNTAVERRLSLSGSDDKNKWYIINDSLLFQRSYSNTEEHYVQTISFPLSSYKYFRLKIDNVKSDPLRIIGAGIFKNGDTAKAPEYLLNPVPVFIQKDSNKISYIVIKSRGSYITDSISIDVNGPKFYNRNAVAYMMHDEHDSIGVMTPVTTFTISSASHSFFTINGQKVETIILEIRNDDNPPLKVMHVVTAQKTQYLLAWLEKGKTYTLLAGNAKIAAPQYDLANFKDAIPASIPILHLEELTLLPKASRTNPKPANQNWLWPTIIGGIIMLTGLTFRLTKDLKQSTKNS